MNEVVLITGASRGIGYELAKKYYQENFKLFLLVRNKTDAEKLKKEFGDSCYPIVADLQLDASENKISEILNKYTNKLDIVINNAGIRGKEPRIANLKTSEVNELLNIHCLGVIRTVQATIPFLTNSTNPRIINVTSRAGSLNLMSSKEYQKRDFSYSYRIAKAAQNMLTVCLHNELNPKGIHVSAVHPGKVKTRNAAADADKEPDESAESIFKWIQTLNKDNSLQYVEPFENEFQW